MVLKELENSELTEIETTIESLPIGLEQIHSKLLQNRCGEKPSRKKMIRDLLMVICGASRTLTLSELAGAIIKDFEQGSAQLQQAKALLGYYGHLVEVSKNDECYVRLCHASLRDYLIDSHSPAVTGLEDFWFSEKDIHCNMSKLCLDVIESTLQERTNSNLIRDWTNSWLKVEEHCIHWTRPEFEKPNVWPNVQNQFFAYAILYYPEHARHPSPAGQTKFDLETTFFRNVRLRTDWHVIHQNMINSCWRLDDPSLEYVASNGLEMASCYQFTELAREILSSDNDHREKEPFFRKAGRQGDQTALTRALEMADFSTAKLLIQKGVQVDVPNQHGLTPINLACYKAQDNMVKLLLKNRRVSEQVCTHSSVATAQSPVHLAVFSGNTKVLYQLHACDANICLSDDNGLTPLHLAVRLRDHTMQQCLIKFGADVTACDSRKRTSLHHAILSTQNETLPYNLQRDALNALSDFLTEEGITVEDVLGKLELQHLENRVFKMVTLLLDSGAEINAKDAWGNTSLTWSKERKLSAKLSKHPTTSTKLPRRTGKHHYTWLHIAAMKRLSRFCLKKAQVSS